MGLGSILRTLLRVRPEPLEVFAACGHGRSYGQWSWVPFRGLPGITECGLWDAIASEAGPSAGNGATAERPLAFVTDIGNDLLFHVEVPQILAWVENCMARLARLGAHTVVTLPPWERLVRLSAARYYITRRLFFPGSKLSWKEMLDSVAALRSGLIEFGSRFGAPIVDPPLAWYGIDPIHIRWSRRTEAWTHCFQSWPAAGGAVSPAASLASAGAVRLPFSPRRLRPHHRRFFGREQTTPQPVYRGTPMTLSLY
jgi:hypothetical protein